MAAAVLGGWIGEAVVKNLVKTVSSYLGNQMKWEANVETALRKLHDALLPIQVVLGRAEKVELNLDQNTKSLIWSLRDAVEEAEDVLDDMEYQRIERQLLERDAREKVCTPAVSSSTDFKFKLINFFKLHGCFSASLFKHNCIRIGKRAINKDDTLSNLNAVVESLERVGVSILVCGLNEIISTSPQLRGGSNSNTKNHRESGHLLKDEVVGRDEDKKKVLKWLNDSEGDKQGSSRISALVIWGIGGVGKTTIAQSMYNDPSLDFQVKMWVCVSINNLGMEEIMRKAIASATGNPPSADIMTNHQQQLRTIVESKKCLLVLDDVWDGQTNQNQEQWQDFIGVLSQYAERGSKILITSRVEHHIFPKITTAFHLGCLKEDESLSLLYKHAFDCLDPNNYSHLKPIGEKIAKKCDGLPLALKILGGLLNTKLEFSSWSSVDEKFVKNTNYVKNVLKLSYQCLPSDIQSCFRICSLFPQDYKFEENELITLWIGLGCLNQSIDESAQPEDIGRSYLDMLVKRSFFVYDYARKRYTMHDLLHDLAQDVSKGECLLVEGNKSVVIPKSLRHLFVNKLNTDLIEKISGLRKLRTLALTYHYSGYFNPSHTPDYVEINDILKQLKSLHALFISNRTMPDSVVIEQLKHLRLFHVNVNILNKPLQPLGKLYQLQSLICTENEEPSQVSDAHQQIECDGVGNLVKLRHLVLPPRVFDKITQLRHLTELQEVELDLTRENANKLSDLRNLNKLRCLRITDEGGITGLEDAKAANIDKKEQLEILSLSLKWTDHDFELHERVYNCLKLRSQSKIKDLTVSNYSGLRAPLWMTSDYLPYVAHFELRNCENLQHLPPLGQLPSLKVLTLENLAGVNHIGTEFCGSSGDRGGFPSLEKLNIYTMKNWEQWTGAENNSRLFPRLKELYMEECPQLKALPALPLSLKTLRLASVGLIALPTWQDIDEHEVCTSSGNNTPLLEDAYIRNCEELMNVQLLLGKCICVEKLVISNCKSLKELPALPLSLKTLELKSVGLIALPGWHDGNGSEASPSLTRLVINNCEELEDVGPFLRKFALLESVGLIALPVWHDGNGSEASPSLTRLVIDNCEELEDVGQFLRKCALLESLSIVKCPHVLQSHESGNLNQVISSVYLDLFDGLSSIRDLTLCDFASIRTLTFLKHLSLESLTIKRCENLISLDGLQALTSLTWLVINGCGNLMSLDGLQALTSLTLLSIVECDNLISLDGLQVLTSLTHLSIKECNNVVTSSAVAAAIATEPFDQTTTPLSFPPIKYLKIDNILLLQIEPLRRPKSVEELFVDGDVHASWLPHQRLLKNLTLMKLYIWYCNALESLPDELPSSLTELNIHDCPELKTLPENMSLKILWIKCCPLVELLPDNILPSLEHLRISECPLLRERYKREGGSHWHTIAHIPLIRID